MIQVALKGLLGRKFRTAMTALAIVLGVAMVSGTYVLTDTINKAFNNIFVDSRKGTSVVVSGKKVVEESLSGRARVPQSLLETVQALPGVAAAAGGIEDSAKIVDRKGKAVTTMGAPTLGYGVDFSQPRFNSLKLATGSWPGADQVAIDKATADSEHFNVGDMISIAIRGPTQKLELTGIVTFGELSSLGGATIAAFDLQTAQKLFGKEGAFDSISVAAKNGVDEDQLVHEILPLLPANVEAKTAADQAKLDADQVSKRLGFVEYFLLSFGGVALFVGAFVIFNTISITVAQRLREFATLRTLGASGRQVLTSIMIEALVIGALSSVVGLFLGLALAKGLSALFVTLGIELPQTGTVFATRTVVVSLVVGTVIAALAGVAPALRAISIPPIAAVREGAVLPRSRFAPYAPYVAAAVVVVSLALLAYGMFAGGVATIARLALLAAGCLLLFIGVAMLSARIVKPLASLLGRPAERIGGLPGRLARENSTRNPDRTVATAAALMIGLALVTFVAVLGQGLRNSIVDTIEAQVRSDYVVSSQNGIAPFPAAAGEAVARTPGVEVVSNVRGDAAKVQGSEQKVTGIDPATITKVFRFDWTDGSDAVVAGMGRTGALITKSLADGEKLRVGSALEVVTPTSKKLQFEVKGIYKSPPLGSLLGAVSISRDTFDSTFPVPKNQNTYVTVQGSPSDSREQALERALAPFPDTKLQTRTKFIDAQQKVIKTLLALLYVLLALSLIVSLFGMVNTLALSIIERTRELGMLRAVGLTRGQVRRMVRHESVITALIGAVLGLPLGVFLGALVTLGLKNEGIPFALPTVSLVIFALVAVLAGILAAILPARRAARLDVLTALQYE